MAAFVAALAVGHASPAASVLPLEQNRWDNPAFVASFTGSYGFDPEKNPGISSEEKKVLEDLAPLIGSDASQAIRTLQAAITPQSSAALDYTLGNLHFQAGNISEAVASYETALRKFPGFARAYKNLGLLHVQQGDFPRALPQLLQAAAIGGPDGTLLGLIGYCYLNDGRLASALDAYRLALVFDPANRDWRLGKAQCLLHLGENKEAIATLEEMLADQPGRGELLLLQANAFLADNQPDRAAANIQIVRALGMATADSLVLLGDIFMNADNPELAVEAYLEALATGKLAPDRQMRAARTLVSRGAWPEADAILARLSPEEEDWPEALKLERLNLEAQTALGRNDDARAAQILESVVGRDPRNGRAILLLADYHAKQGDVERADLYYTRAATVAATEVEALIQHARMLVGRREFARAVELLARAQALRPQSHVASYLAKVESAAAAMR